MFKAHNRYWYHLAVNWEGIRFAESPYKNCVISADEQEIKSPKKKQECEKLEQILTNQNETFCNEDISSMGIDELVRLDLLA